MIRFWLSVGLIGLMYVTTADAQEAAVTMDQIYQQARHDSQQTLQNDKKREARFLAARDKQQAQLNVVKQDLAREQRRDQRLKNEFESNNTLLKQLQTKLDARSATLTKFFSAVREVAVGASGMFYQSLVSAQYPDRMQGVQKLADSAVNPSMPEVEQLWQSILHEMNESAKVARFTAPVVITGNNTKNMTVTRIGTFDALADGHYLRYLPDDHELTVLDTPLGSRDRARVSALEAASGGYHLVGIDPSGGADLTQIMQAREAAERMTEGHEAGYLALALGLIGILMPLRVERSRWPGTLSGAILITFGVFILMTSMLNLFSAGVAPLPRYEEVDFVQMKQPKQTVESKAKVLPAMKPLPQQLRLPPQLSLQNMPKLPPDISPMPIPRVSTDVRLTGNPMIGRVGMGGTGLKFDNEAIPLVQIPPVYPMRAQRLRISGSVIVEFTINGIGRVENPVIVKSDPPKIFDQSVIQAILHWRFKPKLENGKVVDRLARQRFDFSPTD